MKRILKKLENKNLRGKRFSVSAGMSLVSASLLTTNAYAAGSNTSSIDVFITFICDWLVKIGAVSAMIGGVIFAMSWMRDDADGKGRALLVLMAGFMIIAIGKAPDIFGL